MILGVAIIAIFAFAFWYGGDAPELRGWTIHSEKSVSSVQNDNPPKKDETLMTPAEKVSMAEKIAQSQQLSDKEKNISSQEARPSAETEKNNEKYSKEQGMVISEDTGKDKYNTAPVPEGKPVPVEPENAVITDKELTCTLSVRCDTILQNIEWLDSEKKDIVPKDGIIFAEKNVTFYKGESVFDLLLREMKRNKIHMEFENTPIYNSAYIEGIGNLYEFDCGELSGWMYKVNGWFPNYGCSRYQLRAGDKVEWVYTCDLGVDVGGYYAASGN